jgi:methylenetetrahydrofolate reductase (NADPH)
VNNELPAPFCYEVLPFGSAEQEAAALAAAPVALTVTCSPKHGPDRTVEVATRLQALGHTVTAHLAARMVRGRDHLDELLARLAAGGVEHVFVIGGDASTPVGCYRAAHELVAELRAHPRAPRTIGIAAYPEGHPLIADAVLLDDLRAKAPAVDYMTTQMCFDAAALLGWLERMRAVGISLPAYVGLPGAVERRRLLEISLRVGVGSSISFLRKQHHARRLWSGGEQAAAHLYDVVIPRVGDHLGIAGVHLFTFNRLVETVQLAERSRGRLLLHAIAQEPHRK